MKKGKIKALLVLLVIVLAGRMLPCRVRLPWMVIVCMSGAS